MILTDQLPGRTIRLAGQEFLYFSGTSYLGIARQEAFTEYLREGFARYGTNYSSSRISNLQLAVFDEAEQYLAAYTGAEAALTFSSGFLAGQAVARQLADPQHFIYAPRTHPALWLESCDTATEKHYLQWVQSLPARIEQSGLEHITLLVNSLDPLYAEAYDFAWVQQLPRHKQFTIIIDDSHALGVIGKNGSGVFGTIQPPPHVELIVVSSLGKALGLPSGVVLGSRQRIEQLKRSPFFTAGSPMPPAYLFAFMQSADLYSRLRQRLFENSTFFRQKTAASGLCRSIHNYPVFYTPHNELYSYLYGHRILTSSFPYPSPDHPFITRIIISALHTSEDIEQIAEIINQRET